jgi:pimeloyl-ACP methyl ester carboxylesterase
MTSLRLLFILLAGLFEDPAAIFAKFAGPSLLYMAVNLRFTPYGKYLHRKAAVAKGGQIMPRELRYFLPLVLLLYASQADAAPSVTETGLEAPGPAGALGGTMLAPGNSKGPVILIIPGSGPTNRDGNNTLGVKASTYKLLAEGLAAKGIISVRIDKRGMFGSAGAVADANAVTVADYARDVQSWVDVIRGKTGASCVWLLGHSEGGLVALASSQSAAGVCGLILVAAPGRPLGEVLREQLKSNPANAPVLAQALAAIEALEAGRHMDVSAMHPALQALFNPKVQGFLISTFALDPARLIADWKSPVLIVQGARDIQVSVLDAQRLKKAAPAAKLLLLPDTNHVLKAVTSPDRAANLAAYADPSLPLAPGIIDGIAGFISGPREAH